LQFSPASQPPRSAIHIPWHSRRNNPVFLNDGGNFPDLHRRSGVMIVSPHNDLLPCFTSTARVLLQRQGFVAASAACCSAKKHSRFARDSVPQVSLRSTPSQTQYESAALHQESSSAPHQAQSSARAANHKRSLLMFSIPRPATIARLATTIGAPLRNRLNPDPHNRFTVTAGVSIFNPAFIQRAALRKARRRSFASRYRK